MKILLRNGVRYNVDALRPLRFKGSRDPKGPVVEIIMPDEYGPSAYPVQFEIKPGYELCIRKRPKNSKEQLR